MVSPGRRQLKIANKLVKFFGLFGIEASVVNESDFVKVFVLDRRAEDRYSTYTLKVMDNGENVQVESFHVIYTRLHEVFNGETIEFFVYHPAMNKAMFSLSLKIKKPLILEVNKTLLTSLLENPAKFFFYLRIAEKKFLDTFFLKMFGEITEEGKFTLSEEDMSKINNFLEWSSKEDLNSTVLLH
jgi:hypothetical protein